jgi:GAF domain-containing protein
MTDTTIRTVNDFLSTTELLDALREVDDAGQCDWRLAQFDVSTSRLQTEEDEARRLMVLKSYDILDSNRDELEFDDLTAEAKDYFNVPIAVVSLVDLGRQWFKSIQGLDADQTPRSCSFCAHVVQRKSNAGVLVVKDATKDFRFQDNPLVAGGPKIRFYAGAPIKSPEGSVLGSFCVIDFEPKPDGLTLRQQERLRSFADQVVYHMITRL